MLIIQNSCVLLWNIRFKVKIVEEYALCACTHAMVGIRYHGLMAHKRSDTLANISSDFPTAANSNISAGFVNARELERVRRLLTQFQWHFCRWNLYLDFNMQGVFPFICAAAPNLKPFIAMHSFMMIIRPPLPPHSALTTEMLIPLHFQSFLLIIISQPKTISFSFAGAES